MTWLSFAYILYVLYIHCRIASPLVYAAAVHTLQVVADFGAVALLGPDVADGERAAEAFDGDALELEIVRWSQESQMGSR